MKIDQVILYHVRMHLQDAFETSFGRIETRDCILLEMFSEGLTGYGECVADREPGYSYETSKTAWHILRDFLVPAVLGTKISTPGELQRKMGFVRGHPMAKAGLEMAYWDLLGKRTGRSLAQLLGGVRRQVDVGVSIGIQRSPSALLETVAGYLEKGYRRVKLKIKPGMDVEETIAVRHAYPDLRLQVDANSAYTLETAESLSPLDDLDLLLIEQPLAEDDLLDHSRLQTKFRTPLCLDESIQSPSHARQALELNSCQIINIKAARIGGLSLAVEVHDLCQLAGIPVWCGGMLETGIGRGANLALAALPNFTLPADISATERYYTQDITLESFRLNPDSTIDVPSGPGLGISIDHRALKEVALDSLKLNLHD